MEKVLFLHDTNLATLRGAELTIATLMEKGKERGHQIDFSYMNDFNLLKSKALSANIVIVNSTFRCAFELELIDFLVNNHIKYIKIEYDYNFCIRRNILCTYDRKIKSCCKPEKFHQYRRLFSHSNLNIFRSPLHYNTHYDFYGEAIANHMILPPLVNVEKLRISDSKLETIPHFGDLVYLKGGHEFVSFAESNPNLEFHVYGKNKLTREMPTNIKFFQPILNDQVLEIFGKTKRYFFKPVHPESSSRVTAEAFLSGCEIIGNDRIGTFSFDFYPNDKERALKEIKEAPDNFWNQVEAIFKKKQIQKAPKLGKVLVYKSYGGLGDIFFAIPAIYKLAKVSKDLDFAVATRLVDFFKKHLKNVNVVDETVARQSEDDYDEIYELGNYPAFRGYDLPHALKYPTHKKVKQHAIQHYIDTISKLHIDIDNHFDGYPYFERKVDEKNPYFVVHHGAGFLLKIWPTEKYAELIEKIHDIYPHLDCKIIQGSDDPDIASFFSKPMPHVSYVTGGMEDVGDAMSGALFHIGNDSGITHVAGAYNVPTVAIYGPTGPGSWGSFAEENILIWGKAGVCNIRCNYDVILSCEHRICLNSVTSDRVLEALYKLLQRAYPEKSSILKLNPEAQFDIRKKDCLIQLKERELLMEFHTQEMREDMQKLFIEKNISTGKNEDLDKVIELLKNEEVIFAIPEFNH